MLLPSSHKPQRGDIRKPGFSHHGPPSPLPLPLGLCSHSLVPMALPLVMLTSHSSSSSRLPWLGHLFALPMSWWCLPTHPEVKEQFVAAGGSFELPNLSTPHAATGHQSSGGSGPECSQFLFRNSPNEQSNDSKQSMTLQNIAILILQSSSCGRTCLLVYHNE